jgi:Fe-S-cluster containining protein
MEGDSFPYDCFRCGVCCRRYQARLNITEAKRIADGLGISLDEFSNKYLDHRWPGKESFLLRHIRGACIFLKRSRNRKLHNCLIHSFRPSSCEEWTPGLHRRECQQGLTRYWGLGVNGEGELTGTKRRLLSFQAFLQLLDRKNIDTAL